MKKSIEEEGFSHSFQAELSIASPGRIKIIGEHVDYNNGYVLPAAIDKTITFKFRKNGTANRCKVQSEDYPEILMVDLDGIKKSSGGWQNYILGVLHEIRLLTQGLMGFDCVLKSELPIGSGVSSSAALECGLAYGLNELFDLKLSKWDIIKLSQRAEHHYVGTQCGIMGQFASVMGKENQVMLLDCDSLDFSYVPMDISPYRLLLLDTNVSHNLATGEYNIRRQQCEEGLAIIQKNFPETSSLRDVSGPMLAMCRKQMSKTVYQRCSFVIGESLRVLMAVEALINDDLKELGKLMYRTHEGLSKKYDVSCPELDFLVDFSKD